MKAPISIGVVGCGYWGPNLVRNFRSLSDCRLKAICDVNNARLEHLQSLYPEVEGHTDYEQMLNGAKLDAVVIATPLRFHYQMARKCLLAGKHILIEKPMACSSAECDELVELAKVQGLVLMVGHTFLYSPSVAAIKRILDDGDLGEIQYIASRRLNLGLFQKDINVTWDLAPHDISIILHFMEESPVSVNCLGSSNITRGIEDVTTLFMTFSKRRCAMITNSWLDPRKVREMTIVGSRRMIVYDDVQPNEKIRIYDSRVEPPPHYDTFAEFHYAYHYGDIYSPFIKQEEPLKIECQHFLDCINNGTAPISNGVQGGDLVRILEAASSSLKNQGQMVALHPPDTSVTSPGGTTPSHQIAKPNEGVASRSNGNGHPSGALPKAKSRAAV